MAKLGTVKNGLRKKARAKRKNPVTAKSASIRKRSSLSLLRVKGFAKKNGLKLVAKGTPLAKAQNPKRRKHKKRRNGLQSGGFSLRRNGLLGNSKADVKQVATIGVGGVVTKMVGGFLDSFLAPQIAKVGAGQYSLIISDAIVALTLVPMVAQKIGGNNAARDARVGGMLAVGFDLVEMFIPQALGWNPFNQSQGVVVANGQNALTPAAVAQIVAATDASPATKAKVAGAMQQLQSGGSFAGGKSIPRKMRDKRTRNMRPLMAQ